MSSARDFVKQLIAPMNQVKRENYPLEKNRAYCKIVDLFEESAKGIELVGRTKWGMLNAVTEYVDHHIPSRSNDARLNNAWFGTGEKLKQQAMQLLIA